MSESYGQPGEPREHLFKILVVGDLGTGKSCVIKRYVHNVFSPNYKSTIGLDFALKVLHLDENTVVRLQLWDIAGQERFGNMTKVYYKEAVGALVVFDVARLSTFEGVAKWKADIDDKITLPDGTRLPVILLANKCDLAKDGVVKNQAQMDAFCQEKNFIGWFETSAKENIGIDDAFRFLVEKILSNESAASFQQQRAKEAAKSGNVKLGESADKGEKSGCCS